MSVPALKASPMLALARPARRPAARLKASTSRAALALIVSGIAAPALAGDFTVPPASGAQKVSGTDHGTIDAGATLNGGSKVGITWSAPATGAGVVIDNHGTVTSTGDRAIDTDKSVSGTFTLNNDGRITAPADDAFRINGKLTDGTVMINNSGIITSAGGQALDFDKAVATSAKVTINNTGGTISSTSSDAIRLGGGTIAITNSGMIETTASDKKGIVFDTDTNFDSLVSLSITNQAGGTISATDDAIKIPSPAASTAAPLITIENSGTIQSTDSGQAIDLADIASKNATITITNKAGGVISAADNDGIRGADGTTLYNYGLITSSYAAGTADTQENSAVRINGKNVAGGMELTVYNYDGATISGAYHGIKASGTQDVLNVTNSEGGVIEGHNGSGVNSNGTGSITNYGLITGAADPAASFGDGDGVDVDHAVTLYNYGQIKGLGSHGIKPGETTPSLSEGVALGGGTIVNGDADHMGALISGANNGILADNSDHGDAFLALSVTNYGTIQGLDGFGIQMVNGAGTFSNTIVNYGLISGTSFAVSMGNGDDLFVYEAGSAVSGTVFAEGGTDTFRLGEKAGTFDLALLGPSATYQDFEILALASGSTWTLTGSSDFAGATQVSGANLVLDHAGLGQSAVAVSNGTLSGTGILGALAAGSGAVIAPGSAGSPIGTLTVNGNASFGAGSLYQVSVTPDGASDRVAVGGSTSIDSGAAVAVQEGPGTFSWEQRYTIISSDGGVSGTFGSVTSDYLFLTPTLSYTDTTVDLTLQRNDVSFASYGATANQRAAANAVERADPYSALYEAVVVGTSAGQVRLGLSQLSGDIYGTLPGVLFNQNLMVNDTILARLRQAGDGQGQGATSPLGFGGPVTAYAESANPAAAPFKALKAPPQPQGPVYATWAQGYGQWLDMPSSGNAVAADSRVGGILVGADATVATLDQGRYTFGLAAGYSSSDTSTAYATADTDTAHIAAYAGAAFDAFKLRGGATFGWSSISSKRYVAIVNETPRASYDGTAGNLFAEAAYTLDLGAAAFEPFAGLGWTSVNLDGFTEVGAPISGLTSPGASFATAYSTLGVRAGYAFALDTGMTLRPRASAAWRHAFGDTNPDAVLAFTSTATAFGIEGLPIAADSLVVDAGIDLIARGGFSLSVGYEGAFADTVSSNAAKATAAYRF